MKRVVCIEELLVWTYQRQCADQVDKRRAHTGLAMRLNTNILLRHAALGVRVDCGGASGMGKNDMHPDAEQVHECVSRLPVTERGLVISHAKTDSIPDWEPDGDNPRMLPKRKSNGKPKVITDGNRRYAYIPIYLHPDPDYVAYVRSVYSTWWEGISRVHSALPVLGDYEVTPPESRSLPWL